MPVKGLARNHRMNRDRSRKQKRQRLRDSYPYYARKCLRIRTKQGGLRAFQLNKAQKYLHSRIQQQIKKNGKVRIVVLKGRQQGISTYVEGRYVHKVTHTKGARVYILTHEAEATTNLFEMVDRYYENLPEEMRPSLGARSSRELSFDALDSGYRVGTAGNRAAGRSQTIQFFHGSEVAFWAGGGNDQLAGVLQAVPDIDGSEIILESTANGVGGVFYDYVMEAQRGEGEWELVFIPWYWQDEYATSVSQGFKRTGDEETLVKLYGLTDEQLQWRRNKIYQLKSTDLFRQEYPCTVTEAFLFSGRPAFNPDYTTSALQECYKNGYTYDLTIQHCKADDNGLLQVWERPRPGRRYVVGCDVAEGLAHGDYSTVDVLDENGDQVAHWRGHVAPDELGIMLKHLGKFYGNAFVGVERNNHGLTTLTALKNTGYKNIYVETKKDERGGEPLTPRIGWYTTVKTKPLMIDHLHALLRDGQSGIRNKATVEECQSYVVGDNGSFNAQQGCFDDRVMSMAIAQQMLLRLPRRSSVGEQKTFKPVGRAGY